MVDGFDVYGLVRLILSGINLLFVIFVLFFERKNSTSRFAWLMVLLFLPVIGMILYILFSGNFFTASKRMRKVNYFSKYLSEDIRNRQRDYLVKNINTIPHHTIKKYIPLVKMNLEHGNSILTTAYDIKIFTHGIYFFEDLCASLENAKESIYMEYFIFHNDKIGNRIMEILCRKAEEGLDVKLIYDDLGSISTPTKFFKRLNKAGGDARPFFQIRIGLAFTLNYRNHRKLTVIDNNLSYIGGINIGDEYANQKGKGRHHKLNWRDTVVRMSGNAVLTSKMNFLLDWFSLDVGKHKAKTIQDVMGFFPEDTIETAVSALDGIMQNCCHYDTKRSKIVLFYTGSLTEDEIDDIAICSSHITFNSMSQIQRFGTRVKETHARKYGDDVTPLSVGIRINPEYSEVETLLYNPCAPGTRFGVTAEHLPDKLPQIIEGFHCHCHCENGSDVFARTLSVIEERFSKWFPSLKWINFGGGHLMTRKDYDRELLVNMMQEFHKRYPWLKVILEPGSAFAWQTGPLVSQVVDIVEDKGIKTAILNVSFTCHMPDCLEMPYMPEVRGAEIVDNPSSTDPITYRLGGNSCLSGDYMGCWRFPQELNIGDNIIFEDMIHYTTVKTNMFNGVEHPSLAFLHTDHTLEMLREFSYKDYKYRMD